MDDIYKMGLHEQIAVRHEKTAWAELLIHRVPGGWLYSQKVQGTFPVFVPFNDEFQDDHSNPRTPPETR